LAERLGWTSAETVLRLVRLLERLGLPTRAPGLDRARLIEAMGHDKKNRCGRLRFVLPHTIGRVELTDAPELEDVRAVLAEL
jgi:3-dehydroquinate synthase